MPPIHPCAVPDGALLDRYRKRGAYADCYTTEIAASVTHAQFVTAFYTTRPFKAERLILKLALSKPSTDAQAAQLAAGEVDSFAAWRVEARGENQLLLADFLGRTRSWLMTVPLGGDPVATRLYFGSAVVPVTDPTTGRPTLGRPYNALLGFHKIYSRMLLRAASRHLMRASAVIPANAGMQEHPPSGSPRPRG